MKGQAGPHGRCNLPECPSMVAMGGWVYRYRLCWCRRCINGRMVIATTSRSRRCSHSRDCHGIDPSQRKLCKIKKMLSPCWVVHHCTSSIMTVGSGRGRGRPPTRLTPPNAPTPSDTAARPLAPQSLPTQPPQSQAFNQFMMGTGPGGIPSFTAGMPL